MKFKTKIWLYLKKHGFFRENPEAYNEERNFNQQMREMGYNMRQWNVSFDEN